MSAKRGRRRVYSSHKLPILRSLASDNKADSTSSTTSAVESRGKEAVLMVYSGLERRNVFANESLPNSATADRIPTANRAFIEESIPKREDQGPHTKSTRISGHEDVVSFWKGPLQVQNNMMVADFEDGESCISYSLLLP